MYRLFIVDTPYQLFNVLNLQFNFDSLHSAKADIFVIVQFKNAEVIVENIKESNVFTEVYTLNRINSHSDKSKIYKWWIAFKRLICPEYVINEQIGNVDMNRFSGKYDEVLASYFNPIVAAMLKINPRAKFIHIEDGTGSYFGNIMELSTGWKYKIISAITQSGTSLSKPDRIYLNNPEFYLGKEQCKINKLPDLTTEFIQLSNQIFNVKVDTEMKHIIWLTDPIQDMAYGEDSNKEVENLCNIFERYKSEITVRIHPRDKGEYLYERFQIDTSEGGWELLINQIDIENKVLLGLFSTAQFTPKMIFDKEPYILFLYKMYRKTDDDQKYRKIDKMIEQLKKHYFNPEKVMIPESMLELIACMDTITSQVGIKNSN